MEQLNIEAMTTASTSKGAATTQHDAVEDVAQLQQDQLLTANVEPRQAETPRTAYRRMLRYYLQYQNGSAGEAAAIGLMTPDSNSSETSSDESDFSTDLDTSSEYDEPTQPAEHHFKYLNILKAAADRLKAADEARQQQRTQNGIETPIEH